MPWMITAGRADETIPCATTTDHVAQLERAGIPVDFRVYDKGHTIDPLRDLADLRAWLAERVGTSLTGRR
jgi:predicted esterase